MTACVFPWTDGSPYNAGDRLNAGVVLCVRVVAPAIAACSVALSWSNAGMHLSAKQVAFVMTLSPPADK